MCSGMTPDAAFLSLIVRVVVLVPFPWTGGEAQYHTCPKM